MSRKHYPSVVQDEAHIPVGYVRACSLYDGKTKEGQRVAARISGLVQDGLIAGFKLAPPIGAKPTPPTSWPLFVKPEEIEHQNKARDARKEARKAGVLPPQASADPSLAQVAVELRRLRDEVALMRLAITSVEQSFLDQATRPAEEATA